MSIKFNFNPKISFNFLGEKVSSNSGLLVVKEFASKLGLEEWLQKYLTPNKKHCKHSFIHCCLQKIYGIISV
ncbi:MAG: transposase [Armatimonadota bacterium]